MGRTKKSATEQIKGTAVNMETGFSFVIGEPCNPGWDELRVAFNKLWAYQYAEGALKGTDVPPETVLGGNREQLEYLVPVILAGLNRMFDDQTLDAVFAPRAVAIAYIMAWYWHMKLHGPRPIYDPRRFVRQKIFLKMEMRCPACNTIYEPHERFKKASVRCKMFLRWLPRHFREYHKWEVK